MTSLHRQTVWLGQISRYLFKSSIKEVWEQFLKVDVGSERGGARAAEGGVESGAEENWGGDFDLEAGAHCQGAPRSRQSSIGIFYEILQKNSGLKRRLGITQWREFSEDMTQVVNILTLCVLRSFSRVWRTYKRVLATREQLRIFNLQRYLPSYSLPLLSAVNKFNYIYWRHSNHCRPMLWHSNNYRPLLGHWFHCRNLSWHSNHWKQL